MSPDQLPPDSSYRPLFLRALLIAGVLGAIETVKGYWAGRTAPNDFGWTQSALANLPWWLLWGLLVPAICAFTDRLPFSEGRRTRAVIAHGAASLVLSFLHLTVSAVIIWAAVSHPFMTPSGQVRQLVAGYLVSDVVTYWAIVAGYASVASQRELRRAERDRHALELRAARLEAESAQLTAQVTEARLDALRMELNPHFLFNTLNTVSALAQRGDSDRAVRVVARLSDLLRRTLGGELDHEVTVAEELDLLDGYLEIERIRYGGRLTVDIAVADAASGALVPTFVLQPLVENAIRHGVSAVRRPVRLDVAAGAVAGRLRLTVRDSGPGFDSPAGPSREGVGLRNTRARLAALYGPAATLNLSSLPAGGAEVTLDLPLRVEAAVRVDT